MAHKATNISDLIQRVTSSCLLNPLSSSRHHLTLPDDDPYPHPHHHPTHPTYPLSQTNDSNDEEDNSDDDDDIFQEPQESFRVVSSRVDEQPRNEKVGELEVLLSEVFEAVSKMKEAYVLLQEAHCPWDGEKMRGADVRVVAELKRLGVLRERYRRSGGGRRGWRVGEATLREVVAPYEATVEELKREVKQKKREIDELKEKAKNAGSGGGGSSSGGGKRASKGSRRKVSCSTQVFVAPGPELFETTMGTVVEASKSFTAMLVSLMRSAHWDIAAAVRSIEAASAANPSSALVSADSIVGTSHVKYALESYVNHKIFQGFDHETFYMDGSLSSLINPDQYRRECFTQYKDMKAMDPIELLGILPTCSFGNFCFKKYLAIVHPKMEESLFGDLEQRSQVLAGHHPRSDFYGEFLRLAKAIWLLHLLSFSSDPQPSHFEATRGAEFHPQYMESIVRISGVGGGGRLGVRQVVGFPVSPGFKLVNGSMIKARVYLVPKDEF